MWIEEIESARGGGRVLHWANWQTWFQVAPGGGRTPVVVLHGGPGATHDEVVTIAELRRSGRDCLLYDQVGNGRSTLLPEASPETWSVNLFLEELDRLIAQVGWSDGYHVIGHSWGGMLALEHALRRPAGLRSLVLSNAHASLALFDQEAAQIAASMQDPSRFEAEHVCRVVPVPAQVQRTAEARAAHPEVFLAMNGPDPFEVTGTLRGWDVTARLSEVAVPALVVAGGHDVVGPASTAALLEHLPDAQLVSYPTASHMPFVEEPTAFLRDVESFLGEVEER